VIRSNLQPGYRGGQRQRKTSFQTKIDPVERDAGVLVNDKRVRNAYSCVTVFDVLERRLLDFQDLAPIILGVAENTPQQQKPQPGGCNKSCIEITSHSNPFNGLLQDCSARVAVNSTLGCRICHSMGVEPLIS
jgi:hypothetical protein